MRSTKALPDMLCSAKSCRYGLLFAKAFRNLLRSAKASRSLQRFAKASCNVRPFQSSMEPDLCSLSFPRLMTADLSDMNYIQ